MITKLTSKPFYGKFFKKITIKHNDFRRLNSSDIARKIKRSDTIKIIKDIKKTTLMFKKMNDTSTKKLLKEGKLIIYFNDDSILEHVPECFTIIEKHSPFDERQVVLQKSNNLIEVKNKLYYGKYRYRICLELSKKWGLHNNAIKIDLYKEISSILPNIKITHTYLKSFTAILYVDCTEDELFYLKLKYEKMITNVFQAVLPAEL